MDCENKYECLGVLVMIVVVSLIILCKFFFLKRVELLKMLVNYIFCGLLLIFVVLIIVVFVFCFFFGVFKFGRKYSVDFVYKFVGFIRIKMFIFNIWFFLDKMVERMEVLGKIV